MPAPLTLNPLDTLSDQTQDDLNRALNANAQPTTTTPEPPDTDVPSAKTVKNQVVANVDALLPPPSMVPMFEAASRKYDVPINVLMSIAQDESNYQPMRRGEIPTQYGRGQGIMQYMPPTSRALGINPYDPQQAIDAAAMQLSERLKKGYSMTDAIAEHFAGPDRSKWGPLTAQYAARVSANAVAIGNRLFPVQPAAPEPERQPAEAPSWVQKYITNPAGNALRQMGQGLAASAGAYDARLLQVMNDIDAGKQVPAADDPLGYSAMSPTDREDARARLTAALQQGIGESAQTVAGLQQGIEAHPLDSDVAAALSAKTWGDFWTAFNKNKIGTIATLLSQSAPSMVAALATGGAVGAATKTAAGFAVGQGAAAGGMDFASSVVDSLAHQGVNLADEAAVKKALADPKLMAKVRADAGAHATAAGVASGVAGGAAVSHLAGAGQRGAVGALKDLGSQAALGATAGGAAEVAGRAAQGQETNPGELAGAILGGGVNSLLAAGIFRTVNGTIRRADDVDARTPVTPDADARAAGGEGPAGPRPTPGGESGGGPSAQQPSGQQGQGQQRIGAGLGRFNQGDEVYVRTAGGRLVHGVFDGMKPLDNGSAQATVLGMDGSILHFNSNDGSTMYPARMNDMTVHLPDGSTVKGKMGGYGVDDDGQAVMKIYNDADDVVSIPLDNVRSITYGDAGEPTQGQAAAPEGSGALPAPAPRRGGQEPTSEAPEPPAQAPARPEPATSEPARPEPAPDAAFNGRADMSQTVTTRVAGKYSSGATWAGAYDRLPVKGGAIIRRTITDEGGSDVVYLGKDGFWQPDQEKAKTFKNGEAVSTAIVRDVRNRGGRVVVAPEQEPEKPKKGKQPLQQTPPPAPAPQQDDDLFSGLDADTEPPASEPEQDEEPAPTPTAVAPSDSKTTRAGHAAKLPSTLAGAKPRYAFGSHQFTLSFDSDLDRAAFIISQAKPSKRDAQYLEFVKNATGMTDAEARAYGAKIRATIKAVAGIAPAEQKSIHVKAQALPKRAPVAAPAQAQPGITTPPVENGNVTTPSASVVSSAGGLSRQNRTRSSKQSIAQMQAIAKDPKFNLLGVGGAPGNAAPMVSIAGERGGIPAAQYGQDGHVTMADGSDLPVHYAVVEADSVLASNSADGAVNPRYYASAEPGEIRALTNGRTAALQAAYRQGTAGGYRAGLTKAASSLGLDPDVIRGMKAPILVRVYPDEANQRQDLAALSNQTGTLGMSPVEKARTDAALVDLGSLKLPDDGDFAAPSNRGFMHAFARALSGRGENAGSMMTTDGTNYSRQFYDRARAAVFHKAYGDDALTSLATEAADADVKNILAALTMAAPEFANVDPGPLDIRLRIVAAVHAIRTAKAEGLNVEQYLAQNTLFDDRDPVTDRFVDLLWSNTRSVRRVADGLMAAAQFIRREQAASSEGDLLGNAPTVKPDDIANRAIETVRKKYAKANQTDIDRSGDLFGVAKPSGAGSAHQPDTGSGQQPQKPGAQPAPERKEDTQAQVPVAKPALVKATLTKSPHVEVAKRWDAMGSRERMQAIRKVADWRKKDGSVSKRGEAVLTKLWAELTPAQARQLADALGATEHPVTAKPAPKPKAKAPATPPKPTKPTISASKIEPYHGGDPYTLLKTRPDTTEAQKDLGRALMRRMLGSRAMGTSLTGFALAGDLGSTGTARLVGQSVRTAADLAAVLQVYRDPRFETFRAIYMDAESKIVGEGTYTSRLPGAVNIDQNMLADVEHDMKLYGATGYWLMHNHPSGSSNPSDGDKRATRIFARRLPGFLGHVVIDHDEYSIIDAQGLAETVKGELKNADLESTPAVPNDYLGTVLIKPAEVASFAKRLSYDSSGDAVYMAVTNLGRVRMIVNVPMDALKAFERAKVGAATAVLRRLSRFGGTPAFRFLFLPSGTDPNQFKSLVGHGLITSVLNADGEIARSSIGPDIWNRDSKKPFMKLGEASDFERIQRNTPAFRAWGKDAPVITPQQAEDMNFVSGQPVTLVAFHGTARPDRVGNQFVAKRATSGPMPFFTSNPELASSYAVNKSDTSLAYEDTQYANWFMVKMPGERRSVPIDRAWDLLTPEERAVIASRAAHIKLDDELENIVYAEDATNGNGNYDTEIRGAGGNHLRALVNAWLSSGDLVHDESRFLTVLRLAGFPKGRIRYNSPDSAFPFVYKVYIHMNKPLVSTDVPEDVMDALRASAARDRTKASPGGGIWDKNAHTIRDWVNVLDNDPNPEYVWTSIPDKVSRVLANLGYDGIIDWSGKSDPNSAHPVYIPFRANQVKSAIGNRGTFDPASRSILKSIGQKSLQPKSFQWGGNITTLKEAERLKSLSSLLRNVVGSGRVRVHTDLSEIPDLVAAGDPQSVQGWTQDGKIHLMLPNIPAGREAAVLLHEAFHAQGHDLLGSTRWKNLVDRLQRMYVAGLSSALQGKPANFWRGAFEKVAGLQARGLLTPDIAAEELGAYAIEHFDAAPSGVKKWAESLVGSVKAWLLTHAGVQAGRLTQGELHSIATTALRDLQVDTRGQAAWSAVQVALDALAGRAPSVGKDARFSRSDGPVFGATDPEDAAAGAYAALSEPATLSIGEVAPGDYVGHAFQDLTGFYTKNVAHPRHIATLYKDFVPVYLAANHQFSTTSQNFERAMPLYKPYHDLPKDSEARVNQVLELGRLMGRTYTAQELAEGITNTGSTRRMVEEDGKPVLRDVPFRAALTKVGDTVRLSGPEAQAYLSLRKMLDAMLDDFRAQQLTDMGFGWVADQLTRGAKPLVIRDIGGGKIVLKGTVYSEAEKAALEKAGDDPVKVSQILRNNPIVLVIRKFQGAKWSPKEQGYVFTKAQQPALEQELGKRLGDSAEATIRALAKMAASKGQAQMLNGIADTIGDIEQEKAAGYVPFTRFGQFVVNVYEDKTDVKVKPDGQGGWIVSDVPEELTKFLESIGAVHDPDTDTWALTDDQRANLRHENSRLVYSERVETGPRDHVPFDPKSVGLVKQGERPISDIRSVAEAIARIRKEWVAGDARRRIVATEPYERTPEGQIDFAGLDMLADAASMGPEWDEIRDSLMQAAAAKGFRAHFFRASLVPGYSTDFNRSISTYMIGMSAYLSRKHHKPEWDRAIAGIHGPNMLRYANEYRNYQNSMQEEFGRMRMITFMAVIGPNISSALVNSTQIVTTSIPIITMGSGVARATTLMLGGAKDAIAMVSKAKTGADLFDLAKAPADVRDEVLKAQREGIFLQNNILEMTGQSRQRGAEARGTSRILNGVTSALAFPFSAAERFNRVSTFIAAVRQAKDPGAKERLMARHAQDPLAMAQWGGRNWSPHNYASWLVDETQFVTGKVNRGRYSRGIGALVMQFRDFMMNYLELGYRYAWKKGPWGKAALVGMTAALVAFSGVWGLPGADDLRQFVEVASQEAGGPKLDLKQGLRDLAYNTTGSTFVADVVSGGLPYALGLADLSERVGLGNLLPQNYSNVDQPLVNLSALVGGPWVQPFFIQPYRAVTQMMGGNIAQGLTTLAPVWIRNPIMAYQWYTDGVRTKAGDRTLPPNSLSTPQIIEKALGIQPPAVTKANEFAAANYNAKHAADAVKKRLRDEAGRAFGMDTSTPEKAKAAQEAQDKAMADVERYNETAAGQASPLRIRPRDLKQAIRREQQGNTANIGRGDMERAENIARTFGIRVGQ